MTQRLPQNMLTYISTYFIIGPSSKKKILMYHLNIYLKSKLTAKEYSQIERQEKDLITMEKSFFGVPGFCGTFYAHYDRLSPYLVKKNAS